MVSSKKKQRKKITSPSSVKIIYRKRKLTKKQLRQLDKIQKSLEHTKKYLRESKKKRKLKCELSKENIVIRFLEKSITKDWNGKLSWLEINRLVFWKEDSPFKISIRLKDEIIKIYHGKRVYDLEVGEFGEWRELYCNLYPTLTNPCVKNGWNPKLKYHYIELSFKDFYLLCSGKMWKDCNKKGDFLNKRLLNDGESFIDGMEKWKKEERKKYMQEYYIKQKKKLGDCSAATPKSL